MQSAEGSSHDAKGGEGGEGRKIIVQGIHL